MIDQERGHFDRLRHHIAAALLHAGGTHTSADVWKMIEKDHAQLWYGEDSVIITQIETTPQIKILHFFLAGGNLKELEVMYPLIEDWGRSVDCERAILVGRKGWERSFLKREGWVPTHTVFSKEM